MIERKDLYNELLKENALRFKDHISINSNSRIIFSGKFGTGKTTFLKEFFSEDNQASNLRKTKFNVISLYPVNYSVSSNEDIFEYLKYDILTEMLNNDTYKFEHINLDYKQNLPFYINNNPEEFVSLALQMLPLIGKNINEGFNKLLDLKKKIQADFDKNKDDISKYNTIKKYIKNHQNKVGSIYDQGIITQIIQQTITRSSNHNIEDSIENVLLIDDLDRIDPEHIFRILNVFAAHFDKQEDEPNKFGFDKVILVCDIENIRNIFKARYGAQTDFNGYIDKFYSHSIFTYSIKEQFTSRILDILYKVNWNTVESQNLEHRTFSYIQNNDHEAFNLFHNLIKMLVDNNEINLRNINKLKGKPLIAHHRATYKGDYINVSEKTSFLRIKHLAIMLGNFSRLLDAVHNCHSPFPHRGSIKNDIITMLKCLFLFKLSYSSIDTTIDYYVNDRKLTLIRKNGEFDLTDGIQTNIELSFNEFKHIALELIGMASNLDYQYD